MEITSLLSRAHRGDSAALHTVIPLVYDELRKLAASKLRHEPDAVTLEPTALVHEAFLRMVGQSFPDCENRSHFYGLASRLMRQVLVDLARSRKTDKRGFGLVLPFVGQKDINDETTEAFLALNDALDRLAAESPIKERLVELRFFGGLTAEESADALSLSVHTMRRELRLAQAWLKRELS